MACCGPCRRRATAPQCCLTPRSTRDPQRHAAWAAQPPLSIIGRAAQAPCSRGRVSSNVRHQRVAEVHCHASTRPWAAQCSNVGSLPCPSSTRFAHLRAALAPLLSHLPAAARGGSFRRLVLRALSVHSHGRARSAGILGAAAPRSCLVSVLPNPSLNSTHRGGPRWPGAARGHHASPGQRVPPRRSS